MPGPDQTTYTDTPVAPAVLIKVRRVSWFPDIVTLPWRRCGALLPSSVAPTVSWTLAQVGCPARRSTRPRICPKRRRVKWRYVKAAFGRRPDEVPDSSSRTGAHRHARRAGHERQVARVHAGPARGRVLGVIEEQRARVHPVEGVVPDSTISTARKVSSTGVLSTTGRVSSLQITSLAGTSRAGRSPLSLRRDRRCEAAWSRGSDGRMWSDGLN